LAEKIETYREQAGYELAGKRVDQVLAILFPDFSRSKLQQWIKAGHVTVDGSSCRAKDRLSGGEWLQVEAHFDEQVPFQPQNIELDVVYADDDLLVINKPAGLVVHPPRCHNTRSYGPVLSLEGTLLKLIYQ